MRLFATFLFFLLVTLISSLLTEEEIDAQFEDYKFKFNKVYKNNFEEFKAKGFFARNLEYIKEQNANSALKFTLELNQFSDVDPEIIKRFTTFNQPPSVGTRGVVFLEPSSFSPGPPEIDFRETGCITPVKDQSYFCNACYAFSGIAALEAHWCLKKNVSVTMSEQQILDCSIGYYGNKGCAGGSQGSSYIYIQTISFGIESDETYPFAETYWHSAPFRCKYDRSRAVATTTGYYRIRSRNETEIANIIAKVGPVSAAMNGAIHSFWYYSSGVYNDPDCPPGTSHAVLIVGYGVDDSYDPPMPYWLCKNSWSPDWGDSGYFKIQRGVNLCGIAGFLIFPDVANETFLTTTTRRTTIKISG